MKARQPRAVGKTYLDLVIRFPLRPIKSDAELDRAIDLIDELLDRDDLDEGERDYLDVLGDLVERYESAAHPLPGATDGEVLRHLIEARGESQAAVARATGIPASVVSEVLSGKRHLNRRQIDRLSAYFKVGPGAFPPTDGRATLHKAGGRAVKTT
jgi:HTH-type transcriptional regulator/antitoxin HigA